MIRSFLILILALGVGGYGLLIARQTSPSDWLYPGKLLGDQIEYQFTPGDENKAALKLDWLMEKSIEVKKDRIANKPAEETQKDTKEFEKLAEEIRIDIKKLEEKGKDMTDLKQTLEAIIESCKLPENPIPTG